MQKTNGEPPLVVRGQTGYGSIMSAVELLDQVKALPRRERQKFVMSVLLLEKAAPARVNRSTRKIKWPDVEARAKLIFGDRRRPNLVLAEREESVF